MRKVRPEVRARMALAGVVAGCMVVTTLAVTGAGADLSGMRFTQSGHLVYNSTLGKVFKIDGGTKSVEAEVPIPGVGPGAQVVETDQNGYVLADGSVIGFGKSDLRVADPIPAPASERPVTLTAAGSAYAVYRQAGQVQRFGENPMVVSTEGPVGQPVVTPEGTVWLHRTSTGQLCQLPVTSARIACTARIPAGHSGSLTLVGEQAVFVDTTARQMQTVGNDGLGRAVSLATLELGQRSIVAANDVDGRIAIVTGNTLQLVDTTELTSGKPAAEPVVKQLKPGRYDQIASSGETVALVDSTDQSLVTLDSRGEQERRRAITAPSKLAKVKPGERPGLTRGDDSRVYVDSLAGEHVLVVDGNGDVTEVETAGPIKRKGEQPKPTPDKPTLAPVQPRTTDRPVAPPPVQPSTERPELPPVTRRPVQPRATERPEPPETTKPPERPVPPPKPTVQASRPGAPRNVAGTAGDGSATVTWSAAAANGAPITAYVVTWTGGSRTVAGSARRVAISGLANGRSYTFTVRARNRVGTGPGVSTAGITLGGPADAPVGLAWTGADGAVTLSWRRPNLNGGSLVRYGVTLDGDPENTTRTSYRWTGLDNGKRYTFQVRAVTNVPGRGLLVGAPATVTATAGGEGTITISQGPAFTEDTEGVCRPEHCYYIHIVARGLQPNATYNFQGHTTNYGDLHDGGDPLTADANGSITVNKFYNDDTGGEVWVDATGPGGRLTSNKVIWRA
ncbi:fibronectin type III domain-containing protein [Kribbella sp. NPDC051770]|uniref:fibronectin type III domain-containing protein n=1 Tax=Kribbella sp. NPDC051770 TaxID=3155413 RepID=UPI00343DDBFB